MAGLLSKELNHRREAASDGEESMTLSTVRECLVLPFVHHPICCRCLFGAHLIGEPTGQLTGKPEQCSFQRRVDRPKVKQMGRERLIKKEKEREADSEDCIIHPESKHKCLQKPGRLHKHPEPTGYRERCRLYQTGGITLSYWDSSLMEK